MDPRTVHGAIVLVGFLPMYVAGGFGYEFPVIGFPALDPTYVSTSWMRNILLSMSAMLFAIAMTEIRGEMSMATFVQYHWFLSAALLKWQLGDTATDMGKIMFVLPHLFTLWSTVLYLSGAGGKSKTN